jgi:hypothetical protein
MPVSGFPEGSAQGKNLRGFTAVVAEKKESTERIPFDNRLFFMGQRLSLKAHDKHLADFFFQCRHSVLL